MSAKLSEYTGNARCQNLDFLGLLNGCKIFLAILNQAGATAPVATIILNTLGGVPVWNRQFVGSYRMVLNGAFPQNKTFVLTGSVPGTSIGYCFANRVDNDQVSIITDDVDMSGPASEGQDGALIEHAFLVIVTP